MAGRRQRVTSVIGRLHTAGGEVPFQVLRAAAHTLVVDFPGGNSIATPTSFSGVELVLKHKTESLGPGVYDPHPHDYRRQDDPPRPPGTGRLSFAEDVYDFSSLFRDGVIIDLQEKLKQLILVWSRKEEIRPAFRDFVASLLYDLQVYRALFDNIDRNIAEEPRTTIQRVHQVALDLAYPEFSAFFDGKLEDLKEQVKGFTKQEHERHGFYFRKQVWDFIGESAFMVRTNLKPRGYAGDSEMMRMLYDHAFFGPTIFAKMMHRHPIDSHAAEAVRNRRQMLQAALVKLSAAHERAGIGRFRFMSVACGPAWELQDLLTAKSQAEQLEIVLLDQDADALGEARAEIQKAEQRLGCSIDATFIQDSVRTMLRTPRLSERWGRFNFLYSMGLFDYLIEPVAKAVLAKLYEMLVPGGEIVIGNFHPKNRTRVYMDYWMDWPLYYRNEDELMDLTIDLPGVSFDLNFEATASQMFLRVKKSDYDPVDS